MDWMQMSYIFAALIFSLCVHECSHAWVALKLGDSTASDQGRVSMNPVVHADLFGSVLFPLAGMFFGGFLFGWAKPVPVDPSRLSPRKWGLMWVAFAGPLSNFILSILAAMALLLVVHLQTTVGGAFDVIVEFLGILIFMNALLALFNLIPLPPLDGADVLAPFLPPRWRRTFESFTGRFGLPLLFGLMISGGLRWIAVGASMWTSLLTSLAGA